MTVKRRSIVWAAGFLILIFAGVTPGQEVRVSPSDRTDQEGDGIVFGGPRIKTQMLYPVSDFSSLPPSYRTITALAFRPDERNTFTRPVSGPARVRLFATDADELGDTFMNNMGDEATVVFEGTLTWQTDDTGPAPRDFDFVIPFDPPFSYDPQYGKNLLAEFVAAGTWDNVGDWSIDSHDTNTGKITTVAGLPSDTHARVRNERLWPAQFTFVPEPMTGDFNMNGELDVEDINSLSAEVLGGLHPKRFDLNDDELVDTFDHKIWVHELKNTWYGDADLNGQFNSSDMVQVFASGKYETGEDAGWAEGDWDGTGFFDSSDMVAAFVDGGYEKGPRPDAAAVPEPNSVSLAFVCAISLIACRDRRTLRACEIVWRARSASRSSDLRSESATLRLVRGKSP